MIDSASKIKFRDTPEGQKKQREVNNASNKKFRDTLEGQKKQQEVDNASKKKIRDTPEGQKKQRDGNNASNEKFRATSEGQKKQQEVDKASKKKMRKSVQFDRDSAFEEVAGKSMVDPIILDTKAYKIIENDFLEEINEGPEYICEICICWNYKKSVLRLNIGRYDTVVFENSYKKNKSDTSDRRELWICHSCDKFLKNKKMSPKAQANNLELNPKYKELEDLCPIELTLISQIIPFMTIVGKQRGSQHGLKGQCVLVPADMSKVQAILPRTCDDNVLISLNLKRRLSDSHFVNRQNIRPAVS